MSHVHPIQEKKITIKAFKKLKSTVYKLDRDNPLASTSNNSIDNHIFR
jgi:hypothetical protein